MKIGITDTMGAEHKFQRYIDWLKSGGDIECIRLSYPQENLSEVEQCDGFILTGGHDVSPGLYGGPPAHPTIKDVDSRRDSFERDALERALRGDKPVLGICRGLQLANVHFGGTLVPDLEESGHPAHRSATDSAECQHSVRVEKDTLLHRVTGASQGVVNSSHHQAVRSIGKGLRISAVSEDGVIEALERAEPDRHKFFLLIQWHPERMADAENPFASRILASFLEDAFRQTMYTGKLTHGV